MGGLLRLCPGVLWGDFCGTEAHEAQVLGSPVFGGEGFVDGRFRPEVGTHTGGDHLGSQFPTGYKHGRSEGAGRRPGFPGTPRMRAAGHWDPSWGASRLLPPPSTPGEGPLQEELAFIFWCEHCSFPKSPYSTAVSSLTHSQQGSPLWWEG